MIYLNFTLYNPAWWNRFESLKTWHGSTPIPNKHWEVEVVKHRNLVRFELGLTTQQDHAGLNLELGLFGYEICLRVYDHRHWDYINNKWEHYD